MIPPIEFDTFKLIIEQHLHFATIHCEKDEFKETEQCYTINLYREHIVDPVLIVQVNKHTGCLVWLVTHKFGESSVVIASLLDAINEIKERRLCYVTRSNSWSED